ncbi:MAG: hypothetical protein JXB85_03980 [Anaerolineales bacterium]|nr:hypothetical protein [Anaerolineales bacterium]
MALQALQALDGRHVAHMAARVDAHRLRHARDGGRIAKERRRTVQLGRR